VKQKLIISIKSLHIEKSAFWNGKVQRQIQAQNLIN